MSKMADNIAFSFDINLLDMYLQIARPKDKPEHRAWERAISWLNRVGKLKGVEEICDGHMVWVRCSVATRDYSLIEGEVAALMQKINRLHRRYVT